MDVLSRPADEFVNDGMVEELWAMKAVEHAEIHFNLLCSVDPRQLHLTPYDNEIYEEFRRNFPDLDVSVVKEADLKSGDGKAKWRAYVEKFNRLEDFSYGTLLRADATEEFQPDNAILVVRIQFWAIEVARNREGCNDVLRGKFRGRSKKEE
ncbi:protein PBDC1 [Culex pipiens pallens]|uniref:protein PBDC1 n=1 Tax=Culex pipiens pallens TaxID=42434 RepID=UPI00195383AB|nr:protein PBDC1 [Culex pipiens pallens]XP_039435971.1 protein PBDC1 [Culex pipiens pallens]